MRFIPIYTQVMWIKEEYKLDKISKKNVICFMNGIVCSFDVFGLIPSKLPLQRKSSSTKEAQAEDWKVVGKDFRVTISKFEEENKFVNG